MPTVNFNINFNKASSNILSYEDALNTFLFGTPPKDSEGNPMPKSTIDFFIKAAQEELEKDFDIKLTKQVIEEEKAFYRNDFEQWGYVRTTYTVMKPISLFGFIATTRQVEYPPEWISSKKTNDGTYFRNINIVPAENTSVTSSVVYSGISPHLGFFGNEQIPNYWKVKYLTGFDKAPLDLVNFIGKLAAVNIFHILGDLILGAGIASQSIGIDGLSQSISSTASATSAGYGARVLGYLKDLEKSYPKLKSHYKGMMMTSI